MLTCTGVSFAHGSNDGQKGMGLIMLILIGIVPTAYALNRAMDESHIPAFPGGNGGRPAGADGARRQCAGAADSARRVSRFLRTRQID